MRELSTDILIVGGGTGGIAAALAAASRGAACIVTEPYEWVGGQLTSQAVPPDENEWIETYGGTRLYQSFRERVRAWYREQSPLTETARSKPRLNPGNGWVSRLCAEPRVMHGVLRTMIDECSPRPMVMAGLTPISAEVEGDRLRAVAFRGEGGGCEPECVISAKMILDATELGDLYALAGVEHAIGAEGASVYGELHGRPDRTDPMDQQAFSWCFALEHRPGEDHTIPPPPSYEFWHSYVPAMDPPWCGPLFSWTVPTHNEAGCRTFPFLPPPEECPVGVWDMWRYRRIVDQALFDPASGVRDVTIVNWVQMDYWLKPLLGVDAAAQAAALAGAREQSLCFLHWMQTRAPRADGGQGFPGLRLRGDEVGTADGFAMAPYIREPRRLAARTIITEGHIGTEQRKREGRPHQDRTKYGCAEPFADSVGIGHYTLDLHPSTAGRNSVYVPAAPFRIPMGSLIPVRVRNLLAAGKGIGVTHITNGCYRMHHTEWNIGESAGALAAWCLRRGMEPAAVHESATEIADFQRELAAGGVRLSWPWET
ncbi:MAG: FAD-dependent oxidoreductase [Phycisphaerae bacterium]|nr:FAD-dependent oxidoreductase [Phycisphaerae bacterium]